MKMNVNNIPEIEKTLSVRLPKVYVDYMTENSTHNRYLYELDEIDILESECFLTEERAKAELKMMKETSARSEWNIDRLTVGECHWREGFVRDI